MSALKSEPGRAAPINPSRGVSPRQIRAGALSLLCVFRLIHLSESVWSETVGTGRGNAASGGSLRQVNHTAESRRLAGFHAA